MFKKKILLAEDSVNVQKVVTRAFAAEEYELIIAEDGKSALHKIKKSKPVLVVAEASLPGKYGYSLCEFIKKDPELAFIPCILLIGTEETLDRERARQAGVDEYIIRPFQSYELIDKVTRLVGGIDAYHLTGQAEDFAPPEEVDESEPFTSGAESVGEEEIEELIASSEEAALEVISPLAYKELSDEEFLAEKARLDSSAEEAPAEEAPSLVEEEPVTEEPEEPIPVEEPLLEEAAPALAPVEEEPVTEEPEEPFSVEEAPPVDAEERAPVAGREESGALSRAEVEGLVAKTFAVLMSERGEEGDGRTELNLDA